MGLFIRRSIKSTKVVLNPEEPVIFVSCERWWYFVSLPSLLGCISIFFPRVDLGFMDIFVDRFSCLRLLDDLPGLFKQQILPERLEKISLSSCDSCHASAVASPEYAYTMALLGEHPRVMATVGEDFTEYRQWLEGKVSIPP